VPVVALPDEMDAPVVRLVARGHAARLAHGHLTLEVAELRFVDRHTIAGERSVARAHGDERVRIEDALVDAAGTIEFAADGAQRGVLDLHSVLLA
jgi:hypothetical protein